MFADIDQRELVWYNQIQDALTKRKNLFPVPDKEIIPFNFHYELMRNILDANFPVQIRGYYSLDGNGNLDLTGRVNVDIFAMSINEIISKMIEISKSRGQRFICPYVGMIYHELICNIINEQISESKREENFPLL